MTKMTIQSSGKGWTMFGAIDGDLARWFERWFSTEEKACRHAEKKGWIVK